MSISSTQQPTNTAAQRIAERPIREETKKVYAKVSSAYDIQGCPSYVTGSMKTVINKACCNLPARNEMEAGRKVEKKTCLPKKVFEIYSETWLPDRLISDRWVSSRLSILLNCKQKRRIKALISTNIMNINL